VGVVETAVVRTLRVQAEALNSLSDPDGLKGDPMKMKVSPRHARKLNLLPKARKWRRQGYSYQDIADTFGLSIRTAWLWVKDQPPGDLFDVRH